MKALRFAVVGDPVAHSKSPAMHNAAFRTLGLPHRFEAQRASVEELPLMVGLLHDGTYEGLNVTVPHKQRVLSLVDTLDESARVAGAANTLVRGKDGRVTAHNTDAPALAEELRRLCEGTLRTGELSEGGLAWREMRGLVLGSGGAARAAIVALGVHLGVGDIVVRARSFADPSKSREFASTTPCSVAPQPWIASHDSEERTLAIVQCTSAGMHGADPGSAVADVVDWNALPDDAIALDVVYVPRDTPWLRAARVRGLRCDDGLGMLARQGALAWQLWLGINAPLGVMRAALE
jgi:shikimate dehydrogenase